MIINTLKRYSVAGTLANEIINNQTRVQMRDGSVGEVRCQVDAISFSAHSDYKETSDFIKEIRTDQVILVHGDAHNIAKMQRQ
jgi:cleavage and polyadenylation specificity factor subunit 3